MAVPLQNPNLVNQQQSNNQTQQQRLPKKTGTGFTNLQRVLQANQNNRLGSTIGQNVSQISQKSQEQLGQAKGQYEQGIGQSVQDIKDARNLSSNISGADYNQGGSEAVSNLGTQQNVDLTGRLRQGYRGPTGLQNQEQLQRQAEDLGQVGRSLTTSQGRQAALQRFVGNANYTEGQRRLDNLLLGQQAPGLTAQGRQAQTTSQKSLQDILSAETRGLGTSREFESETSNLTNQLRGSGEKLSGNLQDRVTGALNTSEQKYKELTDALDKQLISQDQYDLLVGKLLSPTDDKLFALSTKDMLPHISRNLDYNKSNIASQKDLAARDALARLAGIQSGDEIVDLDEAQAGTAKDALNFQDVNKFKDKVFDARREFGKGTQEVQNLESRSKDIEKELQDIENQPLAGDYVYNGSDGFGGPNFRDLGPNNGRDAYRMIQSQTNEFRKKQLLEEMRLGKERSEMLRRISDPNSLKNYLINGNPDFKFGPMPNENMPGEDDPKVGIDF